MQGTFAEEGHKRVRLDAMTNVPWDTLSPGHNRVTQQRMREHQGQEAKYMSLTEDKRHFVPKVSPYPEGPDTVFPGTPCYKLNINGQIRHVFILDKERGWDGKCRAQTAARWIVPHFIYRDYGKVGRAKERWKLVYTHNSQHTPPLEPPKKDVYDSTVLGGHHSDADPRLPDDSYYVRGEDNPCADAPQINDPVLSPPFNTNHRMNADHLVRPFPYDQDPSVFPQRAPPALVFPPNPAGARAGAPPQVEPLRPHASLLDVEPFNNLRQGRAGVDWIALDRSLNWEIGVDTLKSACEMAEELDYAFALSMQGLRGTNLSAVWTCIDPEYDVSDRSMVLSQFVKAYMERFYHGVSVTGSTDVAEVVHEALRMHEEFCKGWVYRHHRTLSSEITAASEALVGLFMDEIKADFPPDIAVTRAHISRYLRRHSDYCGEFAHCLYHYMTSMEHMRGNRNPSYKAMNSERAAQITSLRKMSEMLFDSKNRERMRADLRSIDEKTLFFDWRFIDWHYVAAQMPQHHKEFDGYTNNLSLFRTRTGGRSNTFPPWQQMRATR